MDIDKSEYDSVQQYFDPQYWSELSEFEKRRYFNLKRNYEVLKSIGMDAQPPPFMLPKKAVEEDVDSESGEPPFVTKRVKAEKRKSNGRKNSKHKKKSDSKDFKKFSFRRDMMKMITSSGNRSVKLNSKSKSIASRLLEGARRTLKQLEQMILTEGNEVNKRKSDTDSEASTRRYPKRNITRKRYTEDSMSSDDYDMETSWKLSLSNLLVSGKKVPTKSHAEPALITPSFLSVFHSGVKGAGIGVWTKVALPKGIVFGPYHGLIVKNINSACKSGYSWKVHKRGAVHHCIDDFNSPISNWLQFINCAECEKSQNLIAFQWQGKIYYRTYKEIEPYTELLVWYGDKYLKELGIDPAKEINKQPAGILGSHQCKVCHGLFAPEEHMIHRRKKHRMESRSETDRKLMCPQCLRLKSESSRDHSLSVKKKYQCDICGKKFLHNYAFTDHAKIHTGEKQLECTECGKTFHYNNSLNRHLLTHSDARPFVCSICNRGFSDISCLRRHNVVHSGKKPHKCEYCKYKSAYRYHVQHHVRRMHSIK